MAQNSRVRSVILFGSLAQGNYTARSDADICIVLRDSDEARPIDRIPTYLGHFLGAPVPVDLLIYTQQELASMRQRGIKLARELMDRSVLLAGATLE
ncbi:MAG: nucleotidyltransferase domain-containing protein [Chloroflexi bacterium]|nr:nucleotidyltransferase domain-containing protein [Chloroflexota bacterium]